MNKIAAIAMVSLSGVLQGCAYMTTYKSDLGSPTTGVSIDAKQRVVIVSEQGNVKRFCAEPSPDALAALSASLGASVLSNSGATKQLSAALGEQAASIGLRTTSIQLMRDSMYRNCEAHINGALDAEEYANLTAHSQNLIVGLLAIEQLTGAVSAHQVSLSTSSEAGSGEKADDEQAQLIAARKDTIAQKRKVADAQKSVADSKSRLTDAEAALEEGESTEEESEKTRETAKAARAELTTAEEQLSDEQANLTLSMAAEKMAQDSYHLAVSRVKARTSGQGKKFTQSSQGGMSDDTAQVVGSSVVAIVDKILGVGTKFQKCFDALTSPTIASFRPEQLNALTSLCTAVTEKIKQDVQSEKRLQEELFNRMRQSK